MFFEQTSTSGGKGSSRGRVVVAVDTTAEKNSDQIPMTQNLKLVGVSS